MKEAQILVVEDENIVAKDVENRLKNMGYKVPAIAATGEDAIAKVEEHRPDLVLMDIMLRGTMDGVTAAEKIRHQFNVPVIYVTAYSDQSTLDRAKISEPYGYLLKPFEERELHSTIEMALYKHKIEKRLKESEQWLATTLKSIGDAVIATDRNGRVAFMNPVAENLTGWVQGQSLGQDLSEVFNIIDEKTRTHVECPSIRILRERTGYKLPYNVILIAKDGNEVPIDDSASPIVDDKGMIIGTVLAFRDITERKMAERVLRQHAQYLIKRVKELNCLYSIFGIFEKQDVTIPELIRQIIQVIPAAWQYPDETCVRIRVEGNEATSEGFQESPWYLRENILVFDKEIGSIEIFITSEKPEKDEGPFLKEERSLIHAIAMYIGHMIERRRSTEFMKQQSDNMGKLIKAINSTFTLSTILSNDKTPFHQIVSQTLDVIPAAMRFPDVAFARIVLENQEFKTSNYVPSDRMFSAEIIASDEKIGVVEVGYLEQRPSMGNDSPFSDEEKSLILLVALQLGRLVERKRNEEKSRHAVSAVGRDDTEYERR
ncbi:MAG: response regulator [Phycisphaerae bacterium]|nr:response regulator [Phycisphaerae bacterium]